MFKCKDCGQEYEIKPEFCDCGNNVFEEILPAPPEPKEIYEIKQEQTYTNTYNENYLKKEKSYKKIDAYAIIIFTICIILSILSFIFIGKENPNEIKKTEKNVEQEKVKQKNDIPAINQLWKENKIKPATQPQKQEDETDMQNQQPAQPVVQTQQEVKPVQTTKPLNQKIQQTTPVYTPQNTYQPKQNKPAQQPVAKPTQTGTNQVKPQPAQTQKVQPQKQKISEPSLENYKTGLRNYLAKDIDFSNIIGDGVCSVSFKLDSAGNLTNRKFSSLSDNDSLNSNVYSAIMNNPTYQSPPTTYKGETLTFTVKMYGSRYYVMLY